MELADGVLARRYAELDLTVGLVVGGERALVVADPGSLGIVLGGSGNGEQIAANKVKGCRAALAWSPETATLAREHNNAQVIGIGARMHTPAEAAAIVDAFVDTPFSQGERHTRRIAMLGDYEATGEIVGLPQG